MPPIPKDESSTGFFSYFRTYVNGWVAAALVLPTAITWKGMPMYETQRSLLTTFTTLFCSLTLAFLYTSYDLLPKFKTRIGTFCSIFISFVLICATIYCAFKYVAVLNESVYYTSNQPDALKTLAMNDIHNGYLLIAYYVLTMVLAEGAFFFMAFRKWRQ